MVSADWTAPPLGPVLSLNTRKLRCHKRQLISVNSTFSTSSAHHLLCSFTQVMNSSSWQIWPSPRLSLAGGEAGYCSVKASDLNMTVGCMLVARDNSWSQHDWEWTGSWARTWVHDSSPMALTRLCRARHAQGLYHCLHRVWQQTRNIKGMQPETATLQLQIIMARSQSLKEIGDKLWEMRHWKPLWEGVFFSCV